MNIRTKKTILYVIFIVLDYIGFSFTMLALFGLYLITHAMLFMLIATDFYSFLVNRIEKSKGKASYFIRIVLALLITGIAVLACWFSAQYLIQLIYPYSI